MVDSPYSEFYERVGAGTATALEKVADIAADVVCGLYSGYSGFMRGVGANDPRGVGMDGMFERLCGPRSNYTPPPPPTPLPPGGRCDNVTYEVTAKAASATDPGQPATFVVTGPVGPTYVRGLSSGLQAAGFYSKGSGPGGKQFNDVVAAGPEQFNTHKWTCQIISINRLDGQADNCGSNQPEYPPTIPPPGELAPVRPIPLPGGPVSLPVTIIPVILRPEINFRPEINVDVGGIEIKFDLGGVTFNFPLPGTDYPRLPPGSDPRPSPPQPTRPAPNPIRPDAETAEEVEKLRDDIKALEECACDEDDKRPVLTQSFASAQSRVINLPVRTKAVTVTITEQPGNAKRQEGVTATDVLYAGWAWFRGYGGLGPRLPLDAAQKTFYPPDEEKQTQFEYTAYNGHSASVVVTYLGDLP